MAADKVYHVTIEAVVTVKTPDVPVDPPIEPPPIVEPPPIEPPIDPPVSTTSPRVQVGASQDNGAFKNWLLGAYSFCGDAGKPAWPSELNDAQYPVGTTTSGQYRGLGIMPGTEFANLTTGLGGTQLVLRWAGTIVKDGVGAIQIVSGVEVDEGNEFVLAYGGFNLFAHGTDGRIVFRLKETYGGGPNPTAISCNFLGGGTYDRITNVILCRLEDEADAWNSAAPERIFTPEYEKLYTDLKMDTFRPMGWSAVNSGMVAQHRHRQPWQTGIGFSSGRWQPSCWVGDITGANNYTCSRPADSNMHAIYVQGETVQGYLANANTSTCTLDAGLGAKPIINLLGYGVDASAGNNLGAGPNTFVYDAVIEAWITNPNAAASVNGNGRALENAGGAPWPLEVRVAFCNLCRMSYWHNFQNQVDDDSVFAEVRYCRDNLAPGLKLKAEYGNEFWNPSFANFHLAARKGAAIGLWDGNIAHGANDNPRRFGWLGLRTRQIAEIAREAWAPRDPAELEIVIDLQLAGGNADESDPVRYAMLGENLTSNPMSPPLPAGHPTGRNELYAKKVGKDYNAAPNRPVDLMTILSGAPYFGGAFLQQFDGNYLYEKDGYKMDFTGITAWADDYASGEPDRVDRAFRKCDDDLRFGKRTEGAFAPVQEQSLKGFFEGWNQNTTGDFGYPGFRRLADRYGLKCEPYEGGWGFFAPSAGICPQLGIDPSYGGPTGKIQNMIIGYKQSAYCRQMVIDYMLQMLAAGWSNPSWLGFGGGNTPGGNPYGIWLNDPLDPTTIRFKAWEAIWTLNNSPIVTRQENT